jgi:hypothetical protein
MVKHLGACVGSPSAVLWVKDVVHLRLGRQGNALALQIGQRVRQVNAALVAQDRRTLDMNLKSSRT